MRFVVIRWFCSNSCTHNLHDFVFCSVSNTLISSIVSNRVIPKSADKRSWWWSRFKCHNIIVLFVSIFTHHAPSYVIRGRLSFVWGGECVCSIWVSAGQAHMRNMCDWPQCQRATAMRAPENRRNKHALNALVGNISVCSRSHTAETDRRSPSVVFCAASYRFIFTVYGRIWYIFASRAGACVTALSRNQNNPIGRFIRQTECVCVCFLFAKASFQRDVGSCVCVLACVRACVRVCVCVGECARRASLRESAEHFTTRHCRSYDFFLDGRPRADSDDEAFVSSLTLFAFVWRVFRTGLCCFFVILTRVYYCTLFVHQRTPIYQNT